MWQIWLFGNWHDLIGAPWAPAALAGVAVLGGGLVGVEREHREKPAGLRTMMLVSLGAAAFTMLSAALPDGGGGRGRIAAQVVAGIGFLGAGAIIRGPRGVSGVTTAATIWAVAALGMVIGAGFAGAGIALSVMVLGVLTTAAGLERRYLGPCRIEQLNLVYATTGGKAEVRIQSILEAFRIPESGRRLTVGEDGLHRLRLNYCSAHKHHHEFLPHLAELAEVVEIHRQAVSDGAATGRPER